MPESDFLVLLEPEPQTPLMECVWPEAEFIDFTATAIDDHYRRYIAAVDLVSPADGVPSAHALWPHAQRQGEATEAISIDRWLRAPADRRRLSALPLAVSSPQVYYWPRTSSHRPTRLE
jgi:hypothetical protein